MGWSSPFTISNVWSKYMKGCLSYALFRKEENIVILVKLNDLLWRVFLCVCFTILDYYYDCNTNCHFGADCTLPKNECNLCSWIFCRTSYMMKIYWDNSNNAALILMRLTSVITICVIRIQAYKYEVMKPQLYWGRILKPAKNHALHHIGECNNLLKKILKETCSLSPHYPVFLLSHHWYHHPIFLHHHSSHCKNGPAGDSNDVPIYF